MIGCGNERARSWVIACVLSAGLSGCFADRGFIGQLAELECSEEKACATGERCDLELGSCVPCADGECDPKEPTQEPTKEPVVEPEEEPSCDAGSSDDDDESESECGACLTAADCSDALPLCVEGECRACETDADCPDDAQCEDGHCKADDETENENEDNSGSNEGENAGDGAGEE